MRTILKRVIFGLLGKEPEARVVSFATGTPERVEAMVSRMRELVPGREHLLVSYADGSRVDGVARIVIEPGDEWLQVRRALSRYRIALAAVLFDGSADQRGLRLAAWACAPTRILAFNAALERHHLRLRCAMASLLFLRGVPLDRIWLRPSWLYPFKKDHSVLPTAWQELRGRPFREGSPRVAIISPYLPWPLSHGGAVRLWALLERASREFDVSFFGFEDGQTEADLGRILQLCPRVYVAAKPRYREPRWSTLNPPEVHEFAPRELRNFIAAQNFALLQGEYTMMAAYRPDVLVEHDVTFDLFSQVEARSPGPGAAWNHWRWERFERRALGRTPRVVVMSEKDRALTGRADAVVIPNGVDLVRFQPTPEPQARRLLFVGSFRHFPNVLAWRWLLDEVWPRLPGDVELTVVAGPNPELYDYRPNLDPRIRLLGFVADVKPLYDETNLVLIPTRVSAGTNLKALEAMAMERAVVSTPSGIGGIALQHLESAWVADDPAGFAEGVCALLDDTELRRRLAVRARSIAEREYGWDAIAERQHRVWQEMLGC